MSFKTVISEAIAELPDTQKAVATMRILEQKSFEDIAKHLGRPVDTVKAIYYRSTEALRKIFLKSGALRTK